MNYQYRILPCPNFSIGDRDIISKYGFITFPSFIDNGFKTEGGIQWDKALKNLKQFRPLFFIANDDEPLKDLEILRKYARNIIFPLHKKKDLEKYGGEFEWIGFPNLEKIRDYDIDWFLKTLSSPRYYDKKLHWLGVHDYPLNRPELILKFHSFDSTLPELYAGKYGKIWRGWRDYYKPSNYLHWRPIFETNVQNFRMFLDTLKDGKKLDEFL